MMPDLGRYAVEVLTAYGVSIALILALIVWSCLRGARVRRALAEAEARQGGPADG